MSGARVTSRCTAILPAGFASVDEHVLYAGLRGTVRLRSSTCGLLEGSVGIRRTLTEAEATREACGVAMEHELRRRNRDVVVGEVDVVRFAQEVAAQRRRVGRASSEPRNVATVMVGFSTIRRGWKIVSGPNRKCASAGCPHPARLELDGIGVTPPYCCGAAPTRRRTPWARSDRTDTARSARHPGARLPRLSPTLASKCDPRATPGSHWRLRNKLTEDARLSGRGNCKHHKGAP